MRRIRLSLALICWMSLGAVCQSPPTQSKVSSFGAFQTNRGEVSYKVAMGDDKKNYFTLNISGTTPTPEVYKRIIGGFAYAMPLDADESTLLVVWSNGAAYETLILNLARPQVVELLDVIGKTFPEVVSTHAGHFVVIGNASQVGNLIDVADVYAFRGNTYRKVETVPYNEKLEAVSKISTKLMNEEVQKRKGTVVKP